MLSTGSVLTVIYFTLSYVCVYISLYINLFENTDNDFHKFMRFLNFTTANRRVECFKNSRLELFLGDESGCRDWV